MKTRKHENINTEHVRNLRLARDWFVPKAYRTDGNVGSPKIAMNWQPSWTVLDYCTQKTVGRFCSQIVQ
jgi:hypothetical protein